MKVRKKERYFPFFSPPLPNKWAGKAAKPLYHSFRQKDTGNDAASRIFRQRKVSVFVQPLSLASLDSSASRGASGETVHFAGTAKASPFGRGVTEGDGEGKPGRKEPLRSDRQALCQSDTIAVSGIRRQRPSPLSRAYARQLPQRGSHWHVGQLSSGRAKRNVSEAAVLRCLGQRQLDKERCPEAAAPASKARPFASCRASGVQWKVIRPAKASPFGRGVTAGDGEGKPGRKEPLRSDGQALCQSDTIAVSGIRRQRPCPLSLTSFASSPRGRAFA